MSARLVRLVASLIVVGLSIFAAVSMTPKLGLDLDGGTQIVLETRDAPNVEADAEATDRALSVLRGRVDALGVAESTLVRSGSNRIIVELPGVSDPREAAEAVGKTAQLTFHPVLDPAGLTPEQLRELQAEQEEAAKEESGESGGDDVTVDEPEPFDPSKKQAVLDEDGAPLLLAPAAMTGDEVTDAAAQLSSEGGGWLVTLDFRGSGQGWAELTGAAACQPPGDDRRRVAIVLDGQVITSPQVNVDVACNIGIRGGSTQITGDFTAESAQDLAALIKGGALPVPVEIVSQMVVGPTLGAAAIDASAKAAVIGLALTGLFILFIYRLMGFAATLALVSYAVIAYALLIAVGATLTLPGLAGFVLAIGMAIDANVLVFERAREEYAAKPKAGVGAALEIGYRKAWTAIADSNVTTLIAAALLFALASGPVKGFGVTLALGVLASMFSGLVVARVFTYHLARTRFVARRPGLTGIGSIGRIRTRLIETNPDLMGRRRLWLGISAALAAVAALGVVVQGLNLGIEFTGGRQLEYATSTPLSPDEAREELADAGFTSAVVQVNDKDHLVVRTPKLTNDEAAELTGVIETAGDGAVLERDDLIGPSMGAELRRNALLAFGIALGLQMLYLAFRFRWVFGAAAVVALFADVLAVVGAFAWLGKPVDGVFLAAVLTIVGVSVNDKVVTFDRVRERLRAGKDDSFGTSTNLAVLETVPRTLNTGIGVMIILAALAVLGGDSLRDFSIALLIGMVYGTVSSVFTASPLLVVLAEKWPVDLRRTEPRRRPTDVNADGAVI